MLELGLNYEQTKILFSIEYQLADLDIKLEKNTNKKKTKLRWLNKFKNSSEDFLKSQQSNINGKRKNSELSSSNLHKPNENLLYIDEQLLIKKLRELGNKIKNNKLPLYLIVLEASLFAPYYPLSNNWKHIASLKGLKFVSKDRNKKKLGLYSDNMNVAPSTVDRFQKSYEKSIKGLRGDLRFKLAAATTLIAAMLAIVALPYLAPLFAPEALSGAAAYAAGLAALGGGAIAAGGLGMTGGTIAIVGGGTLLGFGGGHTLARLFEQAPDFTLTEAAKLEVVLSQIILYEQKDVRYAQELIKEQRNTTRLLEDHLLELQTNNRQNAQKIKNLEKNVELLRKAIARNEKNLAEAA